MKHAKTHFSTLKISHRWCSTCTNIYFISLLVIKTPNVSFKLSKHILCIPNKNSTSKMVVRTKTHELLIFSFIERVLEIKTNTNYTCDQKYVSVFSDRNFCSVSFAFWEFEETAAESLLDFLLHSLLERQITFSRLHLVHSNSNMWVRTPITKSISTGQRVLSNQKGYKREPA